jgi:hypothetical protein
MNVQVRHDVAEEHVVDMTGREGAADRATHMLNISPVLRQLLRCQITEVGDVPTPEDHRCVPHSNRPSLQEGLAGAPTIEGPV